MATRMAAVAGFISVMAPGVAGEGGPKNCRRSLSAAAARLQAAGAGGCTVRLRLHTGAARSWCTAALAVEAVAAVADRLHLGSEASAEAGGVDAAPRAGQDLVDGHSRPV